MSTILFISVGLNVGLALLLVWRELEHESYEDQQRTLNRCLREELCDLIRHGRRIR